MINTNLFASGIITEEQLADDLKKYPLKRYGRLKKLLMPLFIFFQMRVNGLRFQFSNRWWLYIVVVMKAYIKAISYYLPQNF